MDVLSTALETCALPQKSGLSHTWHEDGAAERTRVQENTTLGFSDLLDLLNPLQHIPLIGTVYRALTGDEIKPEVQVAGGFLYGAVTGSLLISGAAGIMGAAFEESTGQEPLVQLAHNLFGDETVQAADPEAGKILLASVEKTGVAPTETLTIAEAGSVGETPTETIDLAQALSVQPVAVARDNESPKPDKAVGKTAPMDSATFGAVIHEQARARQAGISLPPDLVHDMMLMALEKYKTAEVFAGANAAIP